MGSQRTRQLGAQTLPSSINCNSFFFWSFFLRSCCWWALFLARMFFFAAFTSSLLITCLFIPGGLATQHAKLHDGIHRCMHISAHAPEPVILKKKDQFCFLNSNLIPEPLSHFFWWRKEIRAQERGWAYLYPEKRRFRPAIHLTKCYLRLCLDKSSTLLLSTSARSKTIGKRLHVYVVVTSQFRKVDQGNALIHYGRNPQWMRIGNIHKNCE